MIPQAAITEWGRTVPWPTVEQTEQDLLLGEWVRRPAGIYPWRHARGRPPCDRRVLGRRCPECDLPLRRVVHRRRTHSAVRTSSCPRR